MKLKETLAAAAISGTALAAPLKADAAVYSYNFFNPSVSTTSIPGTLSTTPFGLSLNLMPGTDLAPGSPSIYVSDDSILGGSINFGGSQYLFNSGSISIVDNFAGLDQIVLSLQPVNLVQDGTPSFGSFQIMFTGPDSSYGSADPNVVLPWMVGEKSWNWDLVTANGNEAHGQLGGITTVPEPSTWALGGLAALMMAAAGGKRLLSRKAAPASAPTVASAPPPPEPGA